MRKLLALLISLVLLSSSVCQVGLKPVLLCVS